MLLITDRTMPEITDEKQARIRPKPPVILCTGFNDRLSTVQADQIGINIILNKPFLIKDLIDTVRQLLEEQ